MHTRDRLTGRNNISVRRWLNHGLHHRLTLGKMLMLMLMLKLMLMLMLMLMWMLMLMLKTMLVLMLVLMHPIHGNCGDAWWAHASHEHRRIYHW